MDEMRTTVERMVLKTLSKELEMPKDMFMMMDCFVKNGCSLEIVLKAMSEFGRYLTEERDMDALKELLKDLPIKFEEE